LIPSTQKQNKRYYKRKLQTIISYNYRHKNPQQIKALNLTTSQKEWCTLGSPSTQKAEAEDHLSLGVPVLFADLLYVFLIKHSQKPKNQKIFQQQKFLIPVST
jgi:hypothetical protein